MTQFHSLAPRLTLQSIITSRSFAFVTISGGLILIGMINLSSAAVAISQQLVFNQLIHLTIGGCVGGLLWFIPLKHLKDYAYLYGGLSLILLGIVLSLGESSGGSQRWIALSGLRFQPSEFAKLTAALIGARFLSDRKLIAAHTLTSLSPLLTITLIFFVLVFKQPDLGTAAIILGVVLSQLFCIPMARRSVIISQIIGVCGILWSWFFLLKDYQKQRIQALLFPDLDPIGSSYNSLQSLIAVGSGGTWGKGFLNSTQSHLQFLPSHHTDFVFSVFAEEHGFVKTLGLIILIFIFLSLCLEIARQARGTFNTLLAVGITASLFLDFSINIAMVIGVFPVVGVPMPFFSYGGSAALKTIIGCSLLLKIESASPPHHHYSHQPVSSGIRQ